MDTTSAPPRRRLRTRAVALGTGAAVGCGALAVGVGALSGIGPATASSHREAPLIAGTPRVDNTDVYAFVSPDRQHTATLIANFYPDQSPTGGPNFFQFDPNARYNLNVDTNGDSKADIKYRWTFKTKVKNKDTFLYNTGPVTSLRSRNLNVVQTYQLQRWRKGSWKTLGKKLIAAPSNVGTASMPNYAALSSQATYSRRGIKAFAGQSDDPFFLDLRVFDLLYGGDFSEAGNDSLAGKNVNTLALQVPIRQLGGSKKVVGVWSTTSVKNSRNKYRQVSRLGSPLVNEVVIGLRDKDRFNASSPSRDKQFAKYVTKPGLPNVIEAVYGIKAPATPRKDLVQVFLTGIPGLNQPKKVVASEMLRLKLKPISGPNTPDRMGVIAGDKNGYPNGRRLGDDVIDISLQVVEGELVGNPNDLGDGVDSNDLPFRNSFPYLALPHSGSAS